MATTNQTRPIALTIAGSDSSGGAGIQADLKTFAANGVYGASALTALTAQNTMGVQAVHTPPADFVDQQLRSVFSDLSVAAVKTGMLANREIVDAVVAQLEAYPSIPVVADPVMVATSGDPLLADDAVESVKTRLVPRATLLTPNLDEAAHLLQCKPAATTDEMLVQAKAIMQFGCNAVLVKGGHFSGNEAVDVLLCADGSIEWLRAPRVETKNTHGTGCTLSAAIAAQLARGKVLSIATQEAKNYLTRALLAGANQRIGKGHGPVEHQV